MSKVSREILWSANPGPQTTALQVSPNEYFEIGFGGRRGGGKAQPYDSLVLTPKGFVAIGSLKIGDIILGINGKSQEILDVFPQGQKDIYKIEFIDGSQCECSDEHLWKVHFSCMPQKKDVYSLNEIRKILERRKFVRAIIPLYTPLQKKDIYLPINPYLLGILLGDGYLPKDSVRISTADKEILKYIEKLGFGIRYRGKFDYTVFEKQNKNTKNEFGRICSNKESLVSRLRDLDLLGKTAYNKFIPEDYLNASARQKTELLKGLLDTDGTADTRGHVSFCSISERLANDVKKVVWSLGGKATLTKKTRKISYNVQINFDDNTCCFRLKRKLDRVINKRYNGGSSFFGRRIVNVVPIGKKDCLCISVSNKDGLYITNDYVVTHNTAGGIGWLLYDKDNPLLRALIIRRNSEDLKDWVDRAKRIYEPLGAKKVGTPPEFHWPLGAIFRTGHLKDANAYAKYVGHEYQRMLIEELNLIPAEENYLKLISSCRSTIPELPPQVMTNFNPSDIGFDWIKKRFRLEGIPDKPIETIDGKTGLKRIFIPSGLKDNPYLDKDPQYNAFLNGLPDGLREAWRDGSWDEPQIQGGVYTLELAQARTEQRLKLVPHDVNLRVHTVWDLGMDDAMSIGFFQRTAIDLRLINYYQNEGFGIDHYQAKLAEFRDLYKYNYKTHYAPFDINKRELGTGQTLKSTAEKIGLKFEVVPNVGVVDGINKTRLMWPRLYINEILCGQFLTAIKNYQKKWDEKLLKFSDEPIHNWTSHAADMLRYASLVEHRMTNDDSVYTPRYYAEVKTKPNPGR